MNWNQNALDFYKKLGAKVMNEWALLRMNDDAMRRLAAALLAFGLCAQTQALHPRAFWRRTVVYAHPVIL